MTTDSEAAEVERLRAECERLERERQLLLDVSADGFWDWNLVTGLTQLSPLFWQLLGRPIPTEFTFEEWGAHAHPADREAARDDLERHWESRGEIPYDREVRYLHQDGHYVTIRSRGRVVEWSEDGKPLRMVGTHTDLTRLVESRTSADILYASRTIGIWDWYDVSDIKQIWSPHFRAVLGLEPDEMEATLENFRSLLHPDDHEATFAMVERVLSGDGSFEYEYRLKHKTLGWRWFRALGEAVFDESGRATRMVGSIQDIHEQRVAQEELKGLAVRHELSLRASKIGVWDWDVQADELVWDDQMYRIYGLDSGDFRGAYEAWAAGLYPADREQAELDVSQALESRSGLDTEFRIVWPSGEVRTIRAIATTVWGGDGKPLRLVGVNWDITEERHRQRELTQTLEELRATNEDLERFVSFASHDLQAPIRHVSSFVQKLEHSFNGTLTGDQIRWIGFVVSGAARMGHLVDDLLNYARAGRAELTREDVDLGVELRSVVEVLQEAFPNARLLVDADDLPVVWGHASRLRQVLQNLLENAVKYRRDGVRPAVRVWSTSTHDRWTIHVADNGQGIPDDLQGRIFEPFQTLSRDDPSSTGMGLAICKRVVERHGGALEVTSTMGEGSEFAFWLPRPSVSQSPASASAPPSIAAEAS